MSKRFQSTFLAYFVLFILVIICSFLQLMFPKYSNVADPSGILILQDFYAISTFVYLIFTTLFGIYLAILTRKYFVNKRIGYFISSIFVLSFPLFILTFISLAGFLRKIFGYVDNGLIRLHQDAVILSLGFIILQFISTLLFRNMLKTNLEKTENI